ncbi:SA1362 family protein [Metabacillus idriensis]|uniref:SA1362 family protein n=1 Tax=Metabacillus idriensis TaxID=324768 RepID=UPI002813D8D1|nr:SA1362 family protein [Metabacillus idriensis]MDR0138406.1 SA1362 family protein [Metabacillus idriensis]
MKNRVNPFVMIVLALGGIGFLATLITRPGFLFREMLIFVIVLAIIYFVVRYFTKQRMGKDSSSYSKAAKQSKKRFSDRNQSSSHLKSVSTQKKSSKTSALKKKQASHLTVIEGKKGKKKSRAFF